MIDLDLNRSSLVYSGFLISRLYTWSLTTRILGLVIPMKLNFLRTTIILVLAYNLQGCFKLNNLSCKPSVDVNFAKLLSAQNDLTTDSLSVITYTGETCQLTF